MGSASGLMVSSLNSRSNGLGSSPGRGHYVVFLEKTLRFHNASLYPDASMRTDEFNAGGITLRWTRNIFAHPGWVASRFMLQKAPGSYADLTLLLFKTNQ